jgi:alpha-L-glutamate ligase-like protein
MTKARDILGMNARQQHYTALNSSQAKSFCSSKYATKVLLQNKNIPTASVHGIFATNEDVNEFPWQTLEKNFVIKPTNGNAGKGVAVFRKQHADLHHWTDAVGHTWSLDEIKLHCSDILEGQYSTYGTNHNVIVEERVPIHPTFVKYAHKGTPDIRIIVFNQVPIMGMLRLPTAESEGRANLHQGAIGCGIDMATGITTHAITGRGQSIQILPNTKRKLNGIRIPQWNKVLTTAVEAANAAGLAFTGVDLFIHEEKGPLVVELNANPGLSIQLANQAGMRRRLERVQDLQVLNPEHGVKIGQALFAENFADKIKAEDGLLIVAPFEEVTVFGNDKQKTETLALLNTGRFRSAIASTLAEKLGLIGLEDLLWFQQEGAEGKVPVVEVTIKLKDRRIKTAMVVSKKLDKLKHNVEIGRKDLGGFLVGENE